MTTIVISSGDTGGGVTLSGGDVLEVLEGGLTLGNSILSGGTELIDAGGADIAIPPDYVTTVFEGGLEDVFGVASGGAVLGGSLLIESGGSATSETISYGGTATIFYGGTADHIAVSSGGTVIVLGTVASNVAVYTGGVAYVSSGGLVTGGPGSGTGISG